MKTWILLLSFMLVSINGYAQVSKLALEYPVAVDEPMERMEYIHIMHKKLWIMMQDKLTDLANEIITQEEYDTWLSNYYDMRMDALIVEKHKIKQALRDSVKYTVDSDNDFKTESK